MKKAAAHILLALFLAGALVPARAKTELLKLPNLIEHFLEHRAATPGLTIFQFCKLHYGADADHHQHEHDHSGLPMKHNCELASISALALVPPHAMRPVERPAMQGNSLSAHDNLFRSFTLSYDIWQPPRRS